MQSYLSLEQAQTLSGAQIQSLKILEYTNQELDAFLQTEYLENPLLETSTDRQEETIQNLEKFYEKGSEYSEKGSEYSGIQTRERDDDVDRRGDIRAKEQGSLEKMILEQLPHERYSKGEWKLLRYLVACLDDNGYFPYEAEEIAKVSGYEVRTVEACLHDLKELEPAGVFAKDLSECLLLQLERAGVEEPKLYEMTEKYLGEILKGQISRITRELHVSTATVKEYMHLLSTLNPKPLAGGNKETSYLVPDILAVREGEAWKVELNDRWMGEYSLNDYYIHMMEEAEDPELKAYFAEKLRRARYVLDCVEQRRNTILKIVHAILEYQSGYFLRREPLKPMTQEEIAEKLHVHSSTVSRAVRGKYLQYQKTVLLKDLFQTAVSKEEQTAPESVKERIRALIEKEEKSSPLSDARLKRLLAEEGITVARRTIAKYREQLGILGSKRRGYL
ncbi:MAG: RNA polymerase factor sigma-54 [Lachnospiraceae bacterium]|nr:RNA polymerase factor sigma-54 [Lachnospiraceae bacterium]